MSWTSIRIALPAFIASRLLVLAFLILGSQTAFLGKEYRDSVWRTSIVLQGQRFLPELSRVAMAGDSWWYRKIALEGYDRGPTAPPGGANWAFFPLYPLAVRTLGLTGNFALDGLLLSNLACLLAFVVFAEVASRSGMAQEDVERAVFYLAFLPASYFLSLPLTESLFLLLSLAAYDSAQRERWWASGLFGGLAALTRVAGVLLLPALLLLPLQRNSKTRWTSLLWLALIPLGTLIFMAHLYRVTGNPFAFIAAQSSWGRDVGPLWRPLISALAHPQIMSEPWNFIALNLAVAVLLVSAGVVLLRQRQWSYGTYVLLSVALPLSAGSLQSVARYAVVAFPLCLWLAQLGRNRIADRVILAVSATLLGWLTALFVLRVDFALA